MSRRPLALAVDAGLALTAYLAAWTLRFGAELPAFVFAARRALPLFVLSQLLGAWLVGGYRRAAPTTVVRFALGTAAGSVVGLGLARWRFGPEGLSHAALVAAATLFIAGGAGWRAVAAIRARRRMALHRPVPPPGMVAIGGPAPLGLSLASLYHYRSLMLSLVSKDLKLKYRGSALGVAWSLLNPLALVAVYSFAFTYIFAQRGEMFVFSLLVGLLAWTFFSSSATMATGAIIDSGSLLKSVRFPRAILPVAVVLFNFSQYLLTLIVFLPIMMLWYQLPLRLAMLGLPLVLLLLAVFTAGVALAMAAATARFRDVRHLLDIALSLMFWLTPIVYTVSQLPEPVRLPVMLNPLASYITASRDIILRGAWPEPSIWAISALYAVAAVAVGATIFQSVEDQLAEQV